MSTIPEPDDSAKFDYFNNPIYLDKQASCELDSVLSSVSDSLSTEFNLQFFSIFNSAKKASYTQLLTLFARLLFTYLYQSQTVRSLLKHTN